MRVEILGLRANLPVRPSEQQVIGDQCVERSNIRVELRDAHPGLELEDLVVRGADERRGHA